MERRSGTTQIHFFMTDEAVALLAQMAESPNKRGQFLSELVMQEARRRGLINAVPDQEPDLHDLARRVAALEAERKEGAR